MPHTPEADSSFEFQRSTRISTLNIELQEFVHKKTGAVHLHLAADDPQNAFLVAFRTVPQDSTGVAHILEHTALCGSKRFPVRDPFFMMTRRSLNTFMNAFTSSDWTAYPFASCNKKDFNNLLQVYLDAAFFPCLDELDFLQEGHRLEFSEMENSDSDLEYKGVVFNEMKGAMSSPISVLWQELSSHLFPTQTYHYNSGGEPKDIPNLSHAELQAFHARHYHPSNAVFTTYGDIPAATHQAIFQQNALNQFDHDDTHIRVGKEIRFTEPKQVKASYAMDEGQDTSNKTHIVVSWLLGENTDAEAVLTAHLMSSVLLDNSASPLRLALETSDLGEAPSPMCGLYDSTLDMAFFCGFEGSSPEHADAAEQLILDTLQKVADEGVPLDQVEAVLHQLELSQREVGGDGHPYGLSLMLSALTPALHDSPIAPVLDIDPILVSLHERIQQPTFIQDLVQQLLLDNQHRVRLVMEPDSTLPAKEKAEEEARLAAMKAGLSEEQKQKIIRRSLQLKERQEQGDDPELLPKVTLDDIPESFDLPEGKQTTLANMTASSYACGTNGLVYQQMIIDIPALSDEQRALLPLFSGLIDELGCGDRDYLQMQALQAAVTGGIHASSSVHSSVDDINHYHSSFVLSGKALQRNQQPLTTLMLEMLEKVRFDESDRIRELIAQSRVRSERSIVGHGHILAMRAASARISPVAALHHQWSGLESIRWIKTLDQELEQAEGMSKLQQQLSTIQQKIIHAPRQILLVAEEENLPALQQQVATGWHAAQCNEASTSGFTIPSAEGRVRQAWVTSTQVHFCAKAYACVASNHDDAAALSVLGPFLRNNFLHRAIREQGGAYGGGASYDSDSGAFRFSSYRDPRLSETLDDFDHSIDWLLNTNHEERLLEEAVLGIIGSMDAPGSPAGEAKSTFHRSLRGRTPEQRRHYRQRILQVTLDDLKRVCATWLKPEEANIAVITHQAGAESIADKLEIVQL